MNKKRCSKIILGIALGILLLFIFLPSPQAQEVDNFPEPTQAFYVYDEGNIINSEVAQYIISTNQDLYSQTGAQIVVAVINSLEGESIEEYSNQLFRYWGIGSVQENNGILLLVALEERQVWIEIGYGLEGAIPDGKAGEILDQYILPNFQQQQYSQGIFQAYESILSIVEEEYQIEVVPQNVSQYDGYDVEGEESGEIGLIQKILLIGGIVLFLFIDFTFFHGMLTFTLLRSASRGGFKGGNRGGGGSSGGGGAGRGW